MFKEARGVSPMIFTTANFSSSGCLSMINAQGGLSSSMPQSTEALELLAPAGNWDCARSAVANGADAVYFGLPRFNARLRADNFTESDLPELMGFLHRHGVRGH